MPKDPTPDQILATIPKLSNEDILKIKETARQEIEARKTKAEADLKTLNGGK